ncbi:DUF6934 family protein [Dawidia soli]|uniref:Uncharacterized protein n=1 Tax=Dawidia soli TaxID=2782352 RepID=A0AAP2DE35_9BACT|nr:hypothetical protein [Dawidia soli]MBT1690496.1 hypothetical protein [Dawidia soli]
MNYESYNAVAVSSDDSIFAFTSIGPKGEIKKIVAIVPTKRPGYYNLGFGDLHADSSMPDDKVVTSNGDRDKILATIAQIVDRYTTRYPRRWLYLRGSTAARSRLYRMAINANLAELSAKYEILGAFEDKTPQPFASGVPFDVFLIRRKNY